MLLGSACRRLRNITAVVHALISNYDGNISNFRQEEGAFSCGRPVASGTRTLFWPRAGGCATRSSLRQSKKRTDRCKQKHRTDLKLDEWAKFDYFSKTNVNDLLGIDVAYPVSPQIDRVHQSRLSVQQFIDNYERPAVPCIITGCADKWRARKEWSFESFSKSYGNTPEMWRR